MVSMVLTQAFDYALCAALAGVLLVVPGMAVARVVRFRSERVVDRCLFTVASSLTVLGFFGYYTALLGAFTAPVLWGFLGACAVVAVAGRGWQWPRPAWPRVNPVAAWRRWTLGERLDAVAWALVLAHVAVLLLSAGTTPFTTWDAIVSWDKWAWDWARRAEMHGYSFSVFGQVMPIFTGALYKLRGATGYEIPAAATFVAHAIHPLLGLGVVLAMWRTLRLLRLPFWPGALLLLGHRSFAWSLTNGYSEVFLLFLLLSGVAFFFAARANELGARWSPFLPMAVCLGGALFVKLSVALWCAVVGVALLAHVWQTQRSAPVGGRVRTLLRHAMPLVVAAGLSAPFYAQQVAYWRNPERIDRSPFNHHFVLGGHVQGLRVSSVKMAETALERKTLPPQFAFIAEYLPEAEFPGKRAVLVLFAALLVATCVAGGATAVHAPFLVGSVVLVGLWMVTASYDTRNVLPILCCVPFLAIGGVERLAAGAGSRRGALWLRGLATVVLVLAIGLPYVGRVANDTRHTLRWTRQRVAAMLHPVENRQKLWFAKERELIELMQERPEYHECRYVFVVHAALFRFMPKFVFADHAMIKPEPGRDLLILPPTHEGPPPDGWEPLFKTEYYTVCIGGRDRER